MMPCEAYQAQLLDYLYDLLDPADRAVLQTHLGDCPACQAALERARRQQRLLSVAVKERFPSVTFRPPERSTTTAAGAESAGPRRWVNGTAWAVAAALLLAVGGVGGAGLWFQHEQQLALQARGRCQEIVAQSQQLLAERQDNLDRRRREIQDAQLGLQRLPAEYAVKVQEFQARQMNVIVTGPETLPAGAPSVYHVRTQNANNQPLPTRLSARVLDQNNSVVYEAKDLVCKGDYALTLPSDMPLKPQTELYLEVAAQRDDGTHEELREKLKLAAPVYVTHLMTDKPMYRPGEVVHFRSLSLDRFSLKPAAELLHLVYTIAAPDGSEVLHLERFTELHHAQQPNIPILMGPGGQPVAGMGAGEFTLSPNRAGGEYTLTVREAENRFAPEKRKFIVNQYERPRLNKELDFSRKSYGPGDEVLAVCRVSRAEGGAPVANQPVTATVFLDGKPYGPDGKEGARPLALQTDAKGAVNVRFRLPAAIDRGQGSLSVGFTDGASQETLVRPIPILLKKLQVEFFPEGGDLVAGAANRVYFQARTTLDKPADLQGRIVDQDGRVAAEGVHTLHDAAQPGVNQGQGAFTFRPEAGKKYELKIDAPAGIEGRYPLPDVRADGVALNIPTGVTAPGQPIQVTVQSAHSERTLLVGVYCRGRLLDHRSVTAAKDTPVRVELHPVEDVGGVYRVTVFEEQSQAGGKRQLIPVAERLVYRRPAQQLHLTATADKKHYVPGDKVKLKLTATDEKDRPVGAVATAAVVDKSVITLADEKTARAMPTHFLLTTEVRRAEDLEYADFLVGTHPQAATALDLLLGTQGWRRFAEQDPTRLRQKPNEDADRLLVMSGLATGRSVSLLQEHAERVQQETAATADQLRHRLADATVAWTVAQKGEAVHEKLDQLRQDEETARQDYAERAARVEHLAGLLRRWSGPVLGGLLVLLAAAVVIGLLRRAAWGVPYYGLVGVTALLLVGTLLTLPRQAERLTETLTASVPALVPDEQQVVQFSRPTEPAAEASAALLTTAPPAPTAAPAGGTGPALDFGWPGGAPGGGGFGGGFGGGPGMGAGGFGGYARNQPAAPGMNPGNVPAFLAPGAGGMLPLARGGAAEADQYHLGTRAVGNGVAHQARLYLWGMQPPNGDVGKDQLEAKQKWADKPQQMAKGKEADDLDGAVKALDRAAKPQGPMLRQLREAELKKDDRKPEPAAEADKRAGVRGFNRGQNFGGLPAPPMAAGGMQAGGRGLGLAADKKRVEELAERRAGGAAAIAVEPCVVREYAHVHPTAISGVRSDFTETLYWNPAVVVPGGKAEISFDLSDSVTTFQVALCGHTPDGRIGAATATVEARLPFALEPKLPVEITAGDTVEIPVSVANNTEAQQAVSLRLDATGLAVQGKAEEQLTLGPDQRARRLFRVQPAVVEGEARVHLEGRSQPFADSITRTFAIVPSGFPVVASHSDMLEKTAVSEVKLPESWMKGTLKCQVNVFPSTLASLQKGLEGLLREPGGCFEQTSSSNYPNLLILDYLRESGQANPQVERRARELLASGYRQLTAFECQDQAQKLRQGYEWFGGTAPPHEALTAYGLLEFRDMARVYDVDPAMVERTRHYLLARRDGKGGFQRNPKSLDQFGRAPDDVTNAYIVWALTEGGKDDDVSKELAALTAQARTSKNPYFLALVANGLLNRGKAEEAGGIVKTLAEVQKPDGSLNSDQPSITGSGGRDLQIETTALTVLAWLKANRPEYARNLQAAVKWIGQQRGGSGSFGSTQSTILALKALIAFTRVNKQNAEAGEVRLFVGPEVVARTGFPADVQEALTLDVPEPEKALHAGGNPVRVEITGNNVFPYTLTWSYRTLKPLSADHCPVRLDARLDRTEAQEGETLHLTVRVENVSGKGQGMAVAVLGLPAGLTLPEDMKQLKDHARLRDDGTTPGLISAWETRGRELVLYWRDLGPDQKVEVPVDLICRVPGQYSGPASRAYLYYNADHKHWVEPLRVTIHAKGE